MRMRACTCIYVYNMDLNNPIVFFAKGRRVRFEFKDAYGWGISRARILIFVCAVVVRILLFCNILSCCSTN